MDFGYNQNVNGTTANSDDVSNSNNDVKVTDINTGKADTGDETTNLDDVSNDKSDDSKSNNTANNTDNDTNNDISDTEDNKTELSEGFTIEVGDETYTVDKNGNVVDKNGAIFKEANEVQDWLKEFEKVNEVDDKNSISIDSVQEAIGIEITDDNKKPIQFENTPEGISAYVNAVIETAKNEHFEAAINTLYEKYPILNDVLNYYIANGNSLDGFGEVPDRSGITVDETNEAQQEAIIRAAWNERGQKGDVDGYIAYLKTTGALAETAKEELSALQEADKKYKQEMEEEAERIENERIETLKNYWTGVHDVIKSRSIAGYQIPESIIINRNGQKLSVTPEDFFNYLYRVDQHGKSAYERDLEKETADSRRDDEILRAYLKFVGGNYSNLVDMAINNKEVGKLRLRAKERNNKTVRIIKPTVDNKNKEIDFGYN